MKSKYWNKEIQNNFNNAAHYYSNYSFVQKYFSKKLIYIIKTLDPPFGNWFDLGAGTGFLADLLEKEFMPINITRVDFCQNMLFENKKKAKTILWDLNIDLPLQINNTSILISSFCIHWLNSPERIIQKWFERLVPGGFLIILFPTNKSFPEWKETCKKCNVEYSGLIFPETNFLKSFFNEKEIFFIKEYNYIETFPNIYKLFKSMIKSGAQSTRSDRLTISELKFMQKQWPKDEFKKVNLTWNINILILRK